MTSAKGARKSKHTGSSLFWSIPPLPKMAYFRVVQDWKASLNTQALLAMLVAFRITKRSPNQAAGSSRANGEYGESWWTLCVWHLKISQNLMYGKYWQVMSTGDTMDDSSATQLGVAISWCFNTISGPEYVAGCALAFHISKICPAIPIFPLEVHVERWIYMTALTKSRIGIEKLLQDQVCHMSDLSTAKYHEKWINIIYWMTIYK